jgi:hypothetical protein
MSIIKVIDGQVVDVCYDRWKLVSDYPDIDFPLNFLMESNPEISNYNAYPCSVLSKPPVDDTKFNLSAKQPELRDGAWVQDWEVIEKTADEKRNLVPVVSMVQFQMALDIQGQLENISAIVASVGSEAAIRWKHSVEVERSAPMIAAFASQLGWSDDEVNKLFQKAATL